MRKLVVPLLLALGGCSERQAPADLQLGAQVYARHCAACHGAKLEGQPDWQQRRADGRLPAPPQDESGHTWHHPDEMLVGIVRFGMVPPYAPQGYASDMPAFEGKLSDAEIRAVLAWIASHWKSKDVLEAREKMIAGSHRH